MKYTDSWPHSNEHTATDVQKFVNEEENEKGLLFRVINKWSDILNEGWEQI